MKSYKNASICVKSHTGLRRKNNEDNYLIVTENQNVSDYVMLVAVADGMGGHDYGEIASKIACEGLADFFKVKPTLDSEDDFCHHNIHHLKVIIHQLHKKILRKA